MDYALLKKLCAIPAVSGNEEVMSDFLVEYVKKHSVKWRCQPEVIVNDYGIALIFGSTPDIGIVAHMDNVGFSVSKDNHVKSIGSPEVYNGNQVCDNDGNCYRLVVDNSSNYVVLDAQTPVDEGTILSFKPSFWSKESFLEGTFLDNRIGIGILLKLGTEMTTGALMFTKKEELGCSTLNNLLKCSSLSGIESLLICDCTWCDEPSGVVMGKGTVLGKQQETQPSKNFVQNIEARLSECGIPYQVGTNMERSSDASALTGGQVKNWAFVGVALTQMHSSRETAVCSDIENLLNAYQELMSELSTKKPLISQ